MKSFKTYKYEQYLLNTYIVVEGEVCPIITSAHMKEFEKIVDRLFDKFGIDFDFTRHFRERMSDGRNKPCIDIKELAAIIKKLYQQKVAKKNPFRKYKDSEAVIKDIQSDIHLPIAIEYNRKDDTLDIVAKTVMRKKNFRTPDPIIRT